MTRHCSGRVGRLCHHVRRRHCARHWNGHRHRGARRYRAGVRRRQDDRGHRVAERQVGRRHRDDQGHRDVERRDARHRHRSGRQPGARSCRGEDSAAWTVRKRQRDVAVLMMNLKYETEKLYLA